MKTPRSPSSRELVCRGCPAISQRTGNAIAIDRIGARCYASSGATAMRVFTVVLLCSLASAVRADPPLVAVLEFRNKLPAEVKDADSGYFSDVVRSNALDAL